MSPGVKTTEFWMHAAVQGAALAVATGLLNQGQADALTLAATKLGALAAMATSAITFTRARTQIKTSPPQATAKPGARKKAAKPVAGMLAFALTLALALGSAPAWAVDPSAVDVPGLPPLTHHHLDDFTVDYSPTGRCDLRRAAIIDTAQKTVDYHAFQLQSQVIQDALIRAARRGVRVRLLLDKTQRPKPGKSDRINAAGMITAGVIIKIDRTPPIAHIKGGIVDVDSAQPVVLGGSFNDSPNALKNTEKCTCEVGGSNARQAAAFFQSRWDRPQTTDW
jgi:hypothetical protein